MDLTSLEAAIIVQEKYEDELDDTTNDIDLCMVAVKGVTKLFPDELSGHDEIVTEVMGIYASHEFL